jgi:acylphosphatase
MNGDDERSVEVVAEGPDAALAKFEQLLNDGPPGARVESVVAHRGPVSGEFDRFGIIRS